MAVYPDGTIGLASRWIEGLKKIDSGNLQHTRAEMVDVRRKFAFLVGTANRDTPGMKLTNLMLLDGRQVLVDVGGAGPFGGRGIRKPDFNDRVTERISMKSHAHLKERRDGEEKMVKVDGKIQQSHLHVDRHGIEIYVPPTAMKQGQTVKTTKEAKIFAPTTSSEFEHGARAFRRVSDGQLRHAATRHGFDGSIADTYIARRNRISDIADLN